MLHHLPSSAALLPGISDLDLVEEGLPTTDELVEHYCKVRDLRTQFPIHGCLCEKSVDP